MTETVFTDTISFYGRIRRVTDCCLCPHLVGREYPEMGYLEVRAAQDNAYLRGEPRMVFGVRRTHFWEIL